MKKKANVSQPILLHLLQVFMQAHIMAFLGKSLFSQHWREWHLKAQRKANVNAHPVGIQTKPTRRGSHNRTQLCLKAHFTSLPRDLFSMNLHAFYLLSNFKYILLLLY